MFEKDIYKVAKKSSKRKNGKTILVLTLTVTPLESGGTAFTPQITTDTPLEASREMWLEITKIAKGSIEELESVLNKKGVEFLTNDTKHRVINIS